MRYFQFLSDRPIIISNDLLLLSRSRVAFLGWPGFSNYHDPFYKAYWGFSFTINHFLSSIVVIASPRNSATGYILKIVKILVFKKRALAVLPTVVRCKSRLRDWDEWQQLWLTTMCKELHRWVASIENRAPGIKINICRIQITDFDMSKIQNLSVHSVFSMTTMVS